METGVSLRAGAWRGLLSTALVAVAMSDSAGAYADDKAECAASHFHAQELRREGKYRAVRGALEACSRPSCPTVIQTECADWLKEIESAIPSIVVEARDDTGRDLMDVEVQIDAERVAARLDGRALEIDPGEHVLRFRSAQGTTIEQRILIREGDRGRAVLVRFPASPRPPASGATPTHPVPDRPSGGISPLGVAFGGVALLAVASFATFAVWGKVKQNELDDCAGHCHPEDLDKMHTRYLIADVSLGVAAVATGAAVIAFLVGRHRADGAAKARVDPDKSTFARPLRF